VGSVSNPILFELFWPPSGSRSEDLPDGSFLLTPHLQVGACGVVNLREPFQRFFFVRIGTGQESRTSAERVN
jgi:hypothetical protein